MAILKINIQKFKYFTIKKNNSKIELKVIFGGCVKKVKKVLIVVDYQNDFVDGSLGFEKAKLLEDNIEKKIKEYKDQKNDVVFTFDTHNDDYLETLEGQKLPVKHCIENTNGWELYGKVSQMFDIDKDVYFKKYTFGSLDLAKYLHEKEYQEVELVGLVSNICVLSNAVLAKSALPQAKIIVDANCTASFDDDMNNKALDILQGIHIEVLNRTEGE